MTELLKVEDLYCRLRRGGGVARRYRCTVDDEGETLALLGRNGTGKTTFMNTLAGATRQHGGTMRFGARLRTKCPDASGRPPVSAGCRRAQHLQVADGG